LEQILAKWCDHLRQQNGYIFLFLWKASEFKAKGSQDKYPPSTEFSSHWIPPNRIYFQETPLPPNIKKYGLTPTTNRKIKNGVPPLPGRLKWNSPYTNIQLFRYSKSVNVWSGIMLPLLYIKPPFSSGF